MELGLIFQIIVIILSIVLHELSHGYTAYFLGDPTAKYSGRLTLNPLKHIEIFGSIIVPLLTYYLGGIVFGWAKPVPYNPYNIKAKYGEVMVALAGPLSNLFLALVFGLYVRHLGVDVVTSSSGNLALIVVIVNLSLFIFNLIPFPPLDGYKVLWGILPYHMRGIKEFLDRNMLLVILIFIFAASYVLDPITMFLFRLITGVGL